MRISILQADALHAMLSISASSVPGTWDGGSAPSIEIERILWHHWHVACKGNAGVVRCDQGVSEFKRH